MCNSYDNNNQQKRYCRGQNETSKFLLIFENDHTEINPLIVMITVTAAVLNMTTNPIMTGQVIFTVILTATIVLVTAMTSPQQ